MLGMVVQYAARLFGFLKRMPGTHGEVAPGMTCSKSVAPDLFGEDCLPGSKRQIRTSSPEMQRSCASFVPTILL